MDWLGQNLCISVGHCHPTVIKRAQAQMEQLMHATTMYAHEQPANLAKEIVDMIPPHPSGQDWVVHLVNSVSGQLYPIRSYLQATHLANFPCVIKRWDGTFAVYLRSSILATHGLCADGTRFFVVSGFGGGRSCCADGANPHESAGDGGTQQGLPWTSGVCNTVSCLPFFSRFRLMLVYGLPLCLIAYSVVSGWFTFLRYLSTGGVPAIKSFVVKCKRNGLT